MKQRRTHPAGRPRHLIGDIHVPDTGSDIRSVPGSRTVEGSRAIDGMMRAVLDKVRHHLHRRAPR